MSMARRRSPRRKKRKPFSRYDALTEPLRTLGLSSRVRTQIEEWASSLLVLFAKCSRSLVGERVIRRGPTFCRSTLITLYWCTKGNLISAATVY